MALWQRQAANGERLRSGTSISESALSFFVSLATFRTEIAARDRSVRPTMPRCADHPRLPEIRTARLHAFRDVQIAGPDAILDAPLLSSPPPTPLHECPYPPRPGTHPATPSEPVLVARSAP